MTSAVAASRIPLRKVAVIIDHWLGAFEFGIACEVFGIDRTAQGLPAFEFVVCSPRPGLCAPTRGSR
jgi:hypothetical protein